MLKALGAASYAFVALSPLAAQANPNCAGPGYRQLDFWVGDWNVFQKGTTTQVGTSRIEKIMSDCSIKESYEAPGAPGGAYSGTSDSSFDRTDGKWHQFYVDVNGNTPWYTGGLDGSDMVMDAKGPRGSLLRMTYRALADGSVEQLGGLSIDGGKTWQTRYDYVYRKK